MNMQDSNNKTIHTPDRDNKRSSNVPTQKTKPPMPPVKPPKQK